MLRFDLYRLAARLPAFKGKSRLVGWLTKVLFPQQAFRLRSGISMILDPVEWLQYELLVHEEAEPLTSALMRRLLRPGDAFVDVGCHVGYHSLLARSFVGISGRVVAVDPQPYNAERTMANWALNGFSNLVVYVGALGSQGETVSLVQQPVTDRARLSLLDQGGNQHRARFAVPVYRLDAILGREGLRNVRLLKIDTEGYELQVLGGAGDALSNIENVILELLPDQIAGAGALIELLKYQHRMQLSTVDGRAWAPGQPLPENNLWASRGA